MPAQFKRNFVITGTTTLETDRCGDSVGMWEDQMFVTLKIMIWISGISETCLPTTMVGMEKPTPTPQHTRLHETTTRDKHTGHKKQESAETPNEEEKENKEKDNETKRTSSS